MRATEARLELVVDPPAVAEPAPLVSVNDLRVHFTTKRGTVYAVDGVDLAIGDGETLGLVGETGSGKSVTARSLVRLLPVPPAVFAGGRARFRPRRPCSACAGSGCDACGGDGRETVDLLTISEPRMRQIRGNHIAMVFQDTGKALNPAMTVRAQLAEVFAQHRSPELLGAAGIDPAQASAVLRRDAGQRTKWWDRRLLSLPPYRSGHARLQRAMDDQIIRALADTQIPNPRQVMDRYPHELSGGMKQRVMIAQALAADPDLLIADEPTTALDVTIQAHILDLLVDLQERRGTAILYISHDLSLVRRISDRVAVMYAGRIVEVGPAGRIFAQPLHPYTRGLLHAIPSPRHRRGGLVAIEGTVPELVEPPTGCRFADRCPSAAAACRRVDPELLSAGGPDQRVACLLYADARDLGVAEADMPVPFPT